MVSKGTIGVKKSGRWSVDSGQTSFGFPGRVQGTDQSVQETPYFTGELEHSVLIIRPHEPKALRENDHRLNLAQGTVRDSEVVYEFPPPVSSLSLRYIRRH